MDVVTRLGEYLLIGRLFSVDSFLKIREVCNIYLFIGGASLNFTRGPQG
jgi:hypothetical protein